MLSLGSSLSLSPAESLGVWLPSISLPFVRQRIGARQPRAWGSSHFLPPTAQPEAAQELPAPGVFLSRDPL